MVACRYEENVIWLIFCSSPISFILQTILDFTARSYFFLVRESFDVTIHLVQ